MDKHAIVSLHLSVMMRCLRGLKREEGSALLELALLMSLFGVPLLLGTCEMSLLTYDSIQVSNAAHAGAMYGMVSSTTASDTTDIATAARNEAPDIGSNLTVTSSTYYACSTALDGTQYSTQAAATTACTGGTNHSLQFVRVATSASLAMPIRVPGMPATMTLNGFSVMEVQE